MSGRVQSRAWLPVACMGFLLVAPGAGSIDSPDEHEVRPLPLSGPLSASEAELSGLTWRGNQLVLLPQFPHRFEGGSGALFKIDRTSLVAAVEGRGEIAPRPIAFDDAGVASAIEGFEGFESIAFVDRDAYLTVEADTSRGTRGFVVKGRVEGDLAAIVLDPDTLLELDSQAEIDNVGYEALVATEDRVVVFFEVNGASNERPAALVFGRDLSARGRLDMEALEYRITDATSVDEAGRFWVTNYFYEGDTWTTDACPISARFGIGASHHGELTIERFVELELGRDGVAVVDRPPLQLKLARTGSARNWEGIARLGNRGFIVATDEHPCTMLAFVPAGS